jgi:gliding motility-associated-like protein
VYTPQLYTPFDFSTEVPELICVEQDIQIDLDIENPNNYSYQWLPSDVIVSGGNTTSPFIRISSADTLTVIVTELATGCFKSRTIPVSGLELPEITVDAEPDFTIYEGKEIEIFVVDSIPGAIYEWSTGDLGTTIIVDPRQTTQYTVTVTDEFGCISTDVVTVTVRNAQCDITDVYLPNAFTPNGDGVNDIFIVRSNFIEELDLIIYNRWGQEIFKTSQLNQGWDGTFNAEEYRATGNVTLIR